MTKLRQPRPIRCINSNLLQLYRLYVSHAEIISKKGHPEFYRRMDRLEALDKCNFYAKWFLGKPNLTIAKVILQIEQDLHRILPDESNTSYSSSCNNLTSIILLSKYIVQKIQINEN